MTCGLDFKALRGSEAGILLTGATLPSEGESYANAKGSWAPNAIQVD